MHQLLDMQIIAHQADFCKSRPSDGAALIEDLPANSYGYVNADLQKVSQHDQACCVCMWTTHSAIECPGPQWLIDRSGKGKKQKNNSTC